MLADFLEPLDDALVGLGDFLAVEMPGEVVGPGAGGFLPAAAGQDAARERAPRNDADAFGLAEGIHLPLFLAVEEVIVVLHGHEAGPAVGIGNGQHLRELPREHRRRPDVERLALAHDVVERLKRFLHRRMRVEAMNLVEIDVVGLQPAQAFVDGVLDMLARKAALVGIVAHGVEDFRGDDEPVARRSEVLQRATDNLFAHAERVDVGRVEKVDASFQRALDERTAFRFLQDPLPPLLRAIGHGAQADSRYFQPR